MYFVDFVIRLSLLKADKRYIHPCQNNKDQARKKNIVNFNTWQFLPLILYGEMVMAVKGYLVIA